jgi:hypothetical protein
LNPPLSVIASKMEQKTSGITIIVMKARNSRAGSIIHSVAGIRISGGMAKGPSGATARPASTPSPMPSSIWAHMGIDFLGVFVTSVSIPPV